MKGSVGMGMTSKHHVTIDGQTITAQSGELLLDAALRNGVDLPYDCRAGIAERVVCALFRDLWTGDKGSRRVSCMPVSAGSQVT